MTSRLVDVLGRCDWRMARYIAGVKWQNRRSSSKVAEMCGVKDLSVGGDDRQEGLGKSGVIVTEDMNLLRVEEHVVQDRWMWRAVSVCPTPSYMRKCGR